MPESTAADVCLNCSPGTYAGSEGSVTCTRCAPGKYQGASGATACSAACEPGSYCAEGAGAPLPCSEGTYSSATNLSSADQCQTTDPGNFAPTGSMQQIPCSRGSVQPLGGKGSCDACAAGKYQANEGQQTCVACEPGFYCPEGAAAALPCAGGSYSTSTSLTSAGDCTPTAPGHFAPTGSIEQTPCSPGTVAPNAGMSSCVKCVAGTFQAEPGQLVCEPCTPGSYCSTEGAGAPTPCPSGTWSNMTGLSSRHDCTKVVMDEWAFTGSTAPKQCPVSGFYCPGYDADNFNELPGSEPIPINSGMSLTMRKVPVISFGVTLEAELSDYHEDDMKARLALLYNVSMDAISLTLEARHSRKRALRDTDSLKLVVTILPADRSEAGVAALSNSIASKSVSAILGSNANISVVQIGEVGEEYEAPCPKGYWCSAGLDIPCSESTYNDKIGQKTMDACKPCPLNSISDEGSISIDACTCGPGYYNSNAGVGLAEDRRCVLCPPNSIAMDNFAGECLCAPGYYDNVAAVGVAEDRQCVLCKTGSICPADVSGVTLETLPLMPGYYRISNISDDLRRCPDFGDSSGCVGGVSLGEGPCKEWLTGPYCRLCNVTDRSRYFSRDSSACLVCEADAGAPLALGFSLFIAVLAIVLLWARFKPHRNVRWLARLVPWTLRLSTQLSLRPKCKQLLSFCA